MTSWKIKMQWLLNLGRYWINLILRLLWKWNLVIFSLIVDCIKPDPEPTLMFMETAPFLAALDVVLYIRIHDKSF